MRSLKPSWLIAPEVLALVTILLAPRSGYSQEPISPPADSRSIADDTYSSPEVEALIDHARSAKSVLSEGLSAYEARMWEIVRVGVMGYSESLHGISKAFKLVHLPKAMAYQKD
jgi:hypothetical protein